MKSKDWIISLNTHTDFKNFLDRRIFFSFKNSFANEKAAFHSLINRIIIFTVISNHLNSSFWSGFKFCYQNIDI